MSPFFPFPLLLWPYLKEISRNVCHKLKSQRYSLGTWSKFLEGIGLPGGVGVSEKGPSHHGIRAMAEVGCWVHTLKSLSLHIVLITVLIWSDDRGNQSCFLIMYVKNNQGSPLSWEKISNKREQGRIVKSKYGPRGNRIFVWKKFVWYSHNKNRLLLNRSTAS